jgi:Icc-related predicted phosphoesterase
VRLVCCSDIHAEFGRFDPDLLPEGDVLLCAGDITEKGNKSLLECWKAQDWMTGVSARYEWVLWIPGNHDFGFDDEAFPRLNNVHCLLNRGAVQLPGLTFAGISLSPCYDMPALAKHWCHMTASPIQEAQIYEQLPPVDVLLSHCPPYGALDTAGTKFVPGYASKGQWQPRHIGSRALLKYIGEHRPQLVVCGHVHEDAGDVTVAGTRIINCARRIVVLDVEEHDAIAC